MRNLRLILQCILFSILILWSSTFIINAHSQINSLKQVKIDSLENRLSRSKQKNKAELLNKLAGEYAPDSTELCIKYANDALRLAKKFRNTEEEGNALYHLGMGYYYQHNTAKTLEMADKALKLARETNNKDHESRAFNLLGMAYRVLKKFEEVIKYCNNALEIAREIKNKEEEANALNNLGLAYYFQSNFQKMLEYSKELLALSNETGDKIKKAAALNRIGMAYYYEADYEKTLEYWEQQLEVNRELDNKSDIALMLSNIGVIYKNWGNYKEALEYYQNALNIQEEIGDTLNIARSFINIGNIYFAFEVDYNKALEYYKKGLELLELIDEKKDMANILNSIGLVYKEQNDYGKANDNYRRALIIFQELGDKQGIAMSQNNMGSVYAEGGNYEMALLYSQNSLKIYEEIGNKKEMAFSLRDIGKVYFKWKKYNQSLKNYFESLKIIKEINLKKEKLVIYEDISEVYAATGNFQQAFEYFKQYSTLKDSIFNEENLKQINELETKYETAKKDMEIVQLASEKTIQEAQIKIQEAQIKQQKMVLYVFIFGFLIILGFSILLYRQYSAKKKANILLEEQNIEIKLQRDQIYQQNKEITDSIQYAQRIQTAILPPSDYIKKIFPNRFLLFLPRDIVSGDFYWLMEKNEKIISVIADCTGHGVPGAFMSMLGIAFLNEIVSKSDHLHPNEILDQLREHVITSLHQTGRTGESQDGMDIVLFILDKKENVLEFAGANNHLFIFRNNELMITKGDNMPIGIHTRAQQPFTSHTIKLQKNDILYTFTDGYPDQFGGPNHKKFMIRKFKKLLKEIHDKPMAEQKNILENTLDKWMTASDQIDDILVMGIKI